MYNPNYVYQPQRPIRFNNTNNRIIGGGFAVPFLLGGLTGGLLAPAFYPRPYYRPMPYPYPNPYYYQYPTYY